MTRIGLVHLSCALAFSIASAQAPRRVVTASPSRREVIAAESASRALVRDTAVGRAGPILVFSRPGGSRRPAVRITGLPAALIIVGVFAGLCALVWRLLQLRRRARVLAERGETQYRALFEQSPCPMFVYDPRTQLILTANHAAVKLLAYTSEALGRLTLQSLFVPNVAGDAMQRLHGGDADQHGALISRMRRGDGSCIDVDVRDRPLDAAAGHGRLLMVLDVTERLSAERALRDAEQRARAAGEMLHSLIDVAPQAIIAIDHEHRVTLWNRAAEALFRWPADEVLGKPVPYIPPEHRKSFVDRKRAVDQRGTLGPTGVTRMRKDGARIELLAAAGAVKNADGTPSGYIGVFTDLTQHRLLEAQLRQSQKLEAVGRLAGGIAHDFNNVLMVITSYVEMLQAQHRDDADSEDLAEIAAAAGRAAVLTRQLLTFSRNEITQLSTVDINDVVTRIQPMLRRVSAEHMHLRTSLAPDLGWVLADVGQLEQVILNLALNASDAMSDGGSLLLETANVVLDAGYLLTHPEVIPGAYVMLAASDTGCGMDEAMLGKIFEPFFTTKEPGRGTGLGLAMAYEAVRQAGGHIWVHSEVGSGTTFQIFLPRVDAAAQSPTAVSQPTTTMGGGGMVLLA